LATIKQHPAWPDLRAAWENDINKMELYLLSELRAKGSAIDGRWVDRVVGQIRGIRHVLDTPERAEQWLSQNMKEGGSS
jgi:hypothetical protein